MTKRLFCLAYSKTLTVRFATILLTLPVIFSVAADNLQVAASWAKPPYIIPHNHSGFEIELITEVFKDLNHGVTFVYMPYEQSVEMLQRKNTDVTLTLNNLSGINSKYLSDVYILYQNAALSLKSKNLPIRNIQNLSKYRVVGFQSASEVLGVDFAGAIEKNKQYIEIADQMQQVGLLLNEQVDVIIIDLNIFPYVSLKLTGTDQFDKVTVHPLFPPSPYSAGFKDIVLMKQFNQALGKYVSSGRYEVLKAKYIFKDIQPVIK
jgi:polar amino acid transport system substrate-binding protein